MEDERISQLGKSETVIEQNIKSLKQLFPQVFTEDKINFSLLEDLFGEKIEDRKEYYELSWAGKSDARKELSKSTVATLTPDREKSVDFDSTQNLFIEGENLEVLRTLQKSYFGKIKMIYIDPPYNTGSDSFVYPDNYSETKKEYEKRIGKVDEEGYINKVELWKQNSKENGQYHSVWLSMMYSRLSYAYSLLADDGVIFISIDDHEQANLKLLCESIFGESNNIGNLSIINNLKGRSDDDFFATCHEYCLVYAKNADKLKISGFEITEEEIENDYKFIDDLGNYKPIGLRKTGKGWKREDRPNMFYPILYKDNFSTINDDELEKLYNTETKRFDDIVLRKIIDKYESLGYEVYLPMNEKGEFGRWRWGKETFEKEKNRNLTFNSSNVINSKMRATLEDGSIRLKSAKTLWYKPQYDTGSSGSFLKSLFNSTSDLFENPKSVSLLKDILITSTKNEDIILDFFAGSCTTGHAVMELNKEDGGNRKFICIQMPEKTDKKSEAYKQGYEKISDIGAERLRRAGKRIKEEIEKERKENDEKLLDKKEIQDIDTGFKYYRLTPSHFKVWQNDINENELGKQLDAFIDATKEGSVEEEMLYELILKSGFSLTTPIEKNSKGFYYIKEWQTCIALENFNKEIIETIFELKPKEVITLDKFFENNDSLLSNTRLEFKDKEIILTII